MLINIGRFIVLRLGILILNIPSHAMDIFVNVAVFCQ